MVSLTLIHQCISHLNSNRIFIFTGGVWHSRRHVRDVGVASALSADGTAEGPVKTSEAVAVDEDSNAPYAEAVATLQYAPLQNTECHR